MALVHCKMQPIHVDGCRGARAGRYIDIWSIFIFFQPRYVTRRYRQHRYSLICVESTAYFIHITAVSNHDCLLLFHNSAYLSPALPPALTHTARPPFHSRHFFKSPTARSMESAGKCGAEELVCKQKTNGSIVWKYFGYKVSDEWQNQVFCRECFKSVATKGSSTYDDLFHHLQQLPRH